MHISQKTMTTNRRNELFEGLIPVALEVYRNDAKIKYTTMSDNAPHERGKREDIYMLSKASLARLVFLVQNTDTEFSSMVTLTYPADYPQSGRVIKSHLNRFLSWVRARFCVQYVWFLEFQRRGAPHFHVLLEGDMTPYKEDVSRTWYDAVGSGDERHLRAGTRTEKIRQAGGARNYAAKYGAKREQKVVPAQFRDVGRFWGASRGVKASPLKSIEVHDMSVIVDTLESVGWQYSDRLTDSNLSTLYNAGKLLIDTLHASG